MPVATINRNHIGGRRRYGRLAPLVAPPGHHGEVVADGKGEARSSTNGFDVGLCRDGDVTLAVEILAPCIQIAIFGQRKAVGDGCSDIFEEQGAQWCRNHRLVDAWLVDTP